MNNWSPKRLLVYPISLAMVIGMLAGCASPGKKLSSINVGMPKTEVIKILGTPTSTATVDKAEVLHYDLNASRALFGLDWDDYFVRLVDGRVESFGKTEDASKSAPPK